MPLALDPNATVPVWLPADADKPEATRPTFRARCMTCREVLAYLDRYEEARRVEKNVRLEHEKLDAVLASAIVGWSNIVGRDGQPIDFAPDKFSDVLTISEKYVLARLIPSAVSVSELEKKASGSSPPDGGEPSAAGAPAGDARTSPPP